MKITFDKSDIKQAMPRLWQGFLLDEFDSCIAIVQGMTRADCIATGVVLRGAFDDNTRLAQADALIRKMFPLIEGAYFGSEIDELKAEAQVHLASREQRKEGTG